MWSVSSLIPADILPDVLAVSVLCCGCVYWECILTVNAVGLDC